MSTYEQQQIDQLEGRLSELAFEFYHADSDEQRRGIADRYEVVFRQLEEAPSWCGEPYLDSQLPDEWMPAPSRKSSSVLQTPKGIQKNSGDKPVVSPLSAMENLQTVDGPQQTDLLADAEAFAKKAGGVTQAHILLDSLPHNQPTTELH